MHWRTIIMCVFVGALVAAGMAGCGSEDGKNGAPLAKVGSREFYETDLDERLGMMAPLSRDQFEGLAGRRQLLGKLVEEEAFFQAAEAAGHAKDESVVAEVERVRRNAMLRAYYNAEIRDKAKPNSEEVEEYYRSHLEEFRTEPRVRIRHVLTKTRKQAERVRELAEMGRHFDKLASNYSIDEKTKDKGGLIPGYLSPGHQVPLLGQVNELVAAAVQLSEDGEVGPVVESAIGFHVIKAEEVHLGGLMPLGDIRGQIERRESERRAAELYDMKFIELTEQFRITYFEDQLGLPSVEELFGNAQSSKTPKQRIRYYQQVMELYPDSSRAHEAQFMVGFTYAEELADFTRAKKAFESVLEMYPDCDLAESARWMLENLGQDNMPDDDLCLPDGVVRIRE